MMWMEWSDCMQLWAEDSFVLSEVKKDYKGELVVTVAMKGEFVHVLDNREDGGKIEVANEWFTSCDNVNEAMELAEAAVRQFAL